MKSETIELLRREDYNYNDVYLLNVELHKLLIEHHLLSWTKKRNRAVVKYFIRWTDKAGYLDIYYE